MTSLVDEINLLCSRLPEVKAPAPPTRPTFFSADWVFDSAASQQSGNKKKSNIKRYEVGREYEVGFWLRATFLIHTV